MTSSIILAALILTAAPRTEADRLIEEGVALRKKGNDREALEKFESAFQLAKTPRAQAQIGFAQQALGLWVDAEANVAAALESKKDPWVKSRIAMLESSLEKIRKHVGGLEVIGPDGAELTIDGRPSGTLPLERPLRLLAGTVTLIVRADGFLPVTRVASIPADGLARETIELVPKPPEPPPPEKKVVQETTRPAITTEVAPRREGTELSTFAWIAAGGAAIGLAGGTALLFVRNGHMTEYNDDAVCLAGGRTRDENCRPKLDSANSAQTGMTVALIGAGVFAAGAAVLFAMDSSEDAPRVGLAAGADAAMVSIAGGF
jgi:hypothetical protein